MEEVILYSTGCPKCGVLKKKMETKQISFTLCEDVEIMKNKGLRSAPALEVNSVIMDFAGAIKWINGLGE